MWVSQLRFPNASTHSSWIKTEPPGSRSGTLRTVESGSSVSDMQKIEAVINPVSFAFASSFEMNLNASRLDNGFVEKRREHLNPLGEDPHSTHRLLVIRKFRGRILLLEP